jgi:hypothetical protein
MKCWGKHYPGSTGVPDPRLETERGGNFEKSGKKAAVGWKNPGSRSKNNTCHELVSLFRGNPLGKNSFEKIIPKMNRENCFTIQLTNRVIKRPL